MGASMMDESARLEALHTLEILDSGEEEAFDRITRVAASVFNAPISLISLVDEERQWFKSRVGLEVCETPRSESFCAHAIGQKEPFIVEDALNHPTFKDNALVTGPPYIRFYAGAQLRMPSAFDLGSLCVIDSEPRPRPSEGQLSILKDLAATVSLMIKQRNLAHKLELEVERRAAAETESRKARDVAEAANATMRSFFSRMSHDLRTPLGIILGYSRFLEEADLPEEQKQDVAEIHKAGESLLGMIDGFLRAGAEEIADKSSEDQAPVDHPS